MTVSALLRSDRWRRRRAFLGTRRQSVTRHQMAICALLIAALAFYMWTAGSTVPFTFPAQAADFYNLLTTGFLHGHTYLPLHAPSGLLALKNPYDPAQNGQWNGTFHDLILYHGRFYSQWGPSPVLTLFAPFRLLTGLNMPESFAAALYGFIGLACAVGLMHLLVRRFVPDTPNWLLVVATAALALTNVIPFLLRRPAVYEVAISCGYALEMAGLLLIAMAVLRPEVSVRCLALGSLCLGLAAGARLSLGAGALVPVATAIYLIRRRSLTRRILVSALVPVGICLLLLALYNDVRFGSFGQFGAKWQITSGNQFAMPTNQLSYVPPGLFSYLLIPARLAITFPHAFLLNSSIYPFPFPSGYGGSSSNPYAEPVGGLLPTMPLTLFLLAAPLLWRRRPVDRRALAAAGALSALGLAIMTLLAYALWGTTQRYEVDYASLFLIAATIVWALVIVAVRGHRRWRRGIATLGTGLAAFGAMLGVAFSLTGYYDQLRILHPGLFNTLEEITSPFATLATEVVGKPVIARVASPFGATLPSINLLTFDDGGASTWLGAGPVEVVIDAPASEHLILQAQAALGPGAKPNAHYVVHVASADGTVASVPFTGPTLRLPIKVDTGLSRVEVNLVGSLLSSPYSPVSPPPQSSAIVSLGTMVLSH